MSTIYLRLTKKNGLDNVTHSETQNGNYTITGTIYDAEDVVKKGRRGNKIVREDVSDSYYGVTCVLLFHSEAELGEALALTKGYYDQKAEQNDKNPFVGLVIEANRIPPLAISQIDGGTNNLILRNFEVVDIEEPQEIVDFDELEETNAIAAKQATNKRNSVLASAFNNLKEVFVTPKVD